MDIKLAISLIPWATSSLGGLPPEQLEDRSHMSVSAYVEHTQVGSLGLSTSVGVASHKQFGESVSGLGLVPLQVSYSFGDDYKVSWAGGIWRYDEPIPVPLSRKTVYSSDLTISKGPIGLTFLHVSNGGEGDLNPGYNGIGVTFRFGL